VRESVTSLIWVVPDALSSGAPELPAAVTVYRPEFVSGTETWQENDPPLTGHADELKAPVSPPKLSETVVSDWVKLEPAIVTAPPGEIWEGVIEIVGTTVKGAVAESPEVPVADIV
jgi:hypothetical protein